MPETLRDIWRGTLQLDYAEEAVIGTTALALRAMQRSADQDSAYAVYNGGRREICLACNGYPREKNAKKNG